MIGLREDQQVRDGMINFLNNTIIQCGSGGATIRLAREGGGSVGTTVTDTPLSRLPHWIGGLIKPVAESQPSKAVG